jgi:DNA-directed RNA polymerase subunit RPC12/RpoP
MNPEPYRKRTLEEIEADLGALTPLERAALSGVLVGLPGESGRIQGLEARAYLFACSRCGATVRIVAGAGIEVDDRGGYRCDECRRALADRDRRAARDSCGTAWMLVAVGVIVLAGMVGIVVLVAASLEDERDRERGVPSSPAWEDSRR